MGARLPRGFAPLRRRARGAAFGGARERNSQVARSGSDQEENFSELEEPSYEDLEAQAMEFMKQQSAIETGDQGKLGGAHRRLSRLSLVSLSSGGEEVSDARPRLDPNARRAERELRHDAGLWDGRGLGRGRGEVRQRVPGAAEVPAEEPGHDPERGEAYPCHRGPEGPRGQESVRHRGKAKGRWA